MAKGKSRVSLSIPVTSRQFPHPMPPNTWSTQSELNVFNESLFSLFYHSRSYLSLVFFCLFLFSFLRFFFYCFSYNIYFMKLMYHIYIYVYFWKKVHLFGWVERWESFRRSLGGEVMTKRHPMNMVFTISKIIKNLTRMKWFTILPNPRVKDIRRI